MKKVQIAKQHRQGQSYPLPTEIIEGKSGMPSKAASQSIPRNGTSAVGQPWEPVEEQFKEKLSPSH